MACKSEPEPMPKPPPKKVEAKAPARQAPPPPPPPPAEEPEPTPEPEKPKAEVRAKPKPSPGCAGECTGSPTAAILSTLRGKAGLARSCYNRALSQNSELSGKMTVQVRIGSNGQVCRVSVSNDTLGDPSVARCVKQRFRAKAFPKPKGGCAEVAAPISFVSQKE